MRHRLVPLVLLVLFACGKEGSGIGQRASDVLAPQVQQVRAAASRGERAEAQRTLVELSQAVADLRRSGDLSEEGASRVLAAVTEVEALLGSTAPAPTQPTTTMPPSSTPRVSPTTARAETRGPTTEKEDGGEEKKQEKGKQKEDEKDEGDDD